jgi:hypothetical protein
LAYWVLYLLSATSALVLLDAGLEKMPSDAIGSHQTALIAAGERAEQKVFYLESAARRAVADAVALLYRDQREFFSKTEGDMHETLDCGTYLYQLWNNEEGSCFDETQIADAFSPHLLGALGRASSVYPSGAFSLAYTLSYDDASFHFSGETLEEPILLGLDPGEDSAEARATMGQYTRGEGILWPSTDDTVITSCFGPRISKNAASTVHHGVDIGARGMVVAGTRRRCYQRPFTIRTGNCLDTTHPRLQYALSAPHRCYCRARRDGARRTKSLGKRAMLDVLPVARTCILKCSCVAYRKEAAMLIRVPRQAGTPSTRSASSQKRRLRVPQSVQEAQTVVSEKTILTL